MSNEQTTETEISAKRVHRVLTWIAEQANKTNLYDAAVSSWAAAATTGARLIGEKNGQIMTAQCLQEFLTGDCEDLPEVEDFAK